MRVLPDKASTSIVVCGPKFWSQVADLQGLVALEVSVQIPGGHLRVPKLVGKTRCALPDSDDQVGGASLIW